MSWKQESRLIARCEGRVVEATFRHDARRDPPRRSEPLGFVDWEPQLFPRRRNAARGRLGRHRCTILGFRWGKALSITQVGITRRETLIRSPTFVERGAAAGSKYCLKYRIGSAEPRTEDADARRSVTHRAAPNMSRGKDLLWSRRADLNR